MARRGRDPEGVHEIRVAAGRLRAWLRLGGRRALRDDLDWLRQRASDVRDLDVLLATGPPSAFARFLSRRRVRLHRELVKALREPRLFALVAGLALVPPLPRRVAARRVVRLAERTLRRARRLDSSSSIEDLHALRRLVRRLRYGLEWIGEDAADVKALQDALGEVNDAAVALARLDEYPGGGSLRAYRRSLESRLAKARRRLQADWLGRPAPARPARAKAARRRPRAG